MNIIKIYFYVLESEHANESGKTPESVMHVKTKKKFIPKCFKCKKRGHLAKNCYRDRKRHDKGNKSYNHDTPEVKTAEIFVTTTSKSSNSESFPNSSDWLLDSGCTAHMTGNKSCYKV